VPAQRLEAERSRLHRLPDAPHTAALGTTRVVNTDQTVRFGSVRYSVPPAWRGRRCGSAPRGMSWWWPRTWRRCRYAGLAGDGPPGLARSPGMPCRHRGTRRSTWRTIRHPQRPDGSPRPPRIEAATEAERRSWRSATAPGLADEAAAAGATRVRAKMAEAVELAALAGTAVVDAALGTARWPAGSATVTCCPSPATRRRARGRAGTVADEAYSSSPAPRPGPGSARARGRGPRHERPRCLRTGPARTASPG